MNKLLFMGAAAAALARSAQAQVLISFDDGQANNSSIGSFYSSLGVTFTDARWKGVVGLAGASGTQGCASLSLNNFSTQASPIGAQFSFTVSTATLRGVDVGLAGFRLKAFDAGNNLIDNQVVTGTGGGAGQFFDLTVNGAISRIEFSRDDASQTTDGVIFDDLSFTAAPVPEPATMATLSLGALALIRRKRAKK